MSRDLTHLDPETREMAHRLIGVAAILGMELYVVHTYRSREEQDALYAQGRTAPGPRVTNACRGKSYHNCTRQGQPAARAIDIAFEAGARQQPSWSSATPEDKRRWELLGQAGEQIGFEWGGRDGTAAHGDLGHFQNPGGMTAEEANIDKPKPVAGELHEPPD